MGPDLQDVRLAADASWGRPPSGFDRTRWSLPPGFDYGFWPVCIPAIGKFVCSAAPGKEEQWNGVMRMVSRRSEGRRRRVRHRRSHRGDGASRRSRVVAGDGTTTEKAVLAAGIGGIGIVGIVVAVLVALGVLF